MPWTSWAKMSSLSEQIISCPYCGEGISVLVDPTEMGEDYIEDCQVCCRPIEFHVSEELDGTASVRVQTDNE